MSDEGGVVHGGLRPEELEALGIDRASVLDLSASLNPRGPHPGVLHAARDADLRRYPPPYAEPLRDALAERAGLSPSEVLVTPGATAAIHLAARALLEPADVCRIFPPTFGEYAAAARAAKARLVEESLQRALEPPDEGLPAVSLTVLCNPNNPTGEYLEQRQVEALVAALQPKGGVLLLDVAYDPFVVDAWDADSLVRAHLPVLVVHSLTKLHAIPGVRLGYVTGPAPLLARLRALQPSWAVGATAIAAGLAALRVEDQQRAAAYEVAQARAELVPALRRAGIEVREGRANFVLVHAGDAASFRRRLLHRGFAVRDCTSFGLPEWVRVAIPPAGALPRLIPALVEAYAAPGEAHGGHGEPG